MKQPVIGDVYVVLARKGVFALVPVAVCFTEDEARAVIGIMRGDTTDDPTSGRRSLGLEVFKTPLFDIAAARGDRIDVAIDTMSVQQAVRRAIDLDAFRKEEDHD